MIGDPYTPGAGVQPPTLAGREEVLVTAESLLDRMVHFGKPASAPLVLTGVRGVGKTVVLHEARRRAAGRGILAVSLTADRSPGLGKRLAEAVGRVLAAAGVNRTGRAWERLVERLSTYDVRVSVAGVVTIGTGAAPDSHARDPGRDQLRDLLEDTCDQVAAASLSGLLLTVDEVQEAPVEDLTLLVTTLQDLAGGDRPIACFLAGLPATPEKLMGAGSFAERFRYQRLENLTPAASMSALLRPAEERGVRWDERAAEAVVYLSGGAPYLLQLYASETWRSAAPDAGSVIDLAAAHEGARSAESVLWNGQYRGRWARSTRVERELLVAIATTADDTGVARTVDLTAHLGKSTHQLSKARASLIDKGIVDAPAHGALAFTVPGFERFVRAQQEGTDATSAADAAIDQLTRVQPALPAAPPPDPS